MGRPQLTYVRTQSFFPHLILFGWMAVLICGIARAGENELPLPRHRLVYENLMILRYNSLGGEELPSLHYRLRLFNKTGPAWEDAHFGVGFQPTADFTQTRLGPTLTFKPIAFFSLTAGYAYNIWYGAFGNLRSYDTPGAEYFLPDDFESSPDVYGTTGHEVLIGARISFAVGPFVFSNYAVFSWTDMALRSGDRWYFQPSTDLLVQNRGWYLANDADLGFITPFGLNVLARTTVCHAFYTDGGQAAGARNTPNVRFGPMLTYMFFDRPLSSFNKPTLIFSMSWWLRNRYRTGAEVSGGLPFLLLAFKFEVDIWWRD